MDTYIASIQGTSPISQGRYHNEDKQPRESPADFEERTWHLRLHVDPTSELAQIPAMGIKNGLVTASAKLGMKVPGRPRATFKGIITSGIIVRSPAPLNFKLADCDKETLFVSSGGKGDQGVGKRVMRSFPTYRGAWKADCEIIIVDPAITQDVLADHLRTMGLIVGLGRFRPEVGGFYGMFNLEDLKKV